MVLVQKCPFFQLFFFQEIYARGMSFTTLQNEKTRVQVIKTKSSKSRKIDIFPKVQKWPLFKLFFFQQYRQEKYILRYYKTKKRLSCFYSLERPFFCFRISEQIFSWSILPKKKKLEKWPLLDFLNLFFLQPRKAFFVLEYRKSHFPGLFSLKKKLSKMAIFKPKPWVNPFGKM